MVDLIQIETTAPSKGAADRIAQALVERRLAACVHVAGPIGSVYRWHGAIERAEEWACSAKTRRDLFDEVAAAVAELHSYDCPELIATPIINASDAYCEWLVAQLG